MPRNTIGSKRRALRWCLCLALVVVLTPKGSLVLAQESHPLQAKLEGLWSRGSLEGRISREWRRMLPETLFELQAESLLTVETEYYRRAYRFEKHDDEALCQSRSPAAFVASAGDFEIFDRTDAIYIIVFEQVRRVYMDGRERPAGFWPNKLGWSDGSWDGNTLVVRTTDFTVGSMSNNIEPIPFGGPDAEMIERYTLSDDGTRLSLQINLEDPKYYTHSMEFNFDFARTEKTLYSADCLPSVY